MIPIPYKVRRDNRVIDSYKVPAVDLSYRSCGGDGVSLPPRVGGFNLYPRTS